MTGIYGNSAEDRHWEKMLHQHLAEQDDTARKEFIEQAVENYLRVGGDFEPFVPDNFAQALGEIGKVDAYIISAFCFTAWMNDKNEFSQASAIRNLNKYVVGYWTYQATAQA